MSLINQYISRLRRFAVCWPNLSAALVLSGGIFIVLARGLLPGTYYAPVNIEQFVAPYMDITTQMLPWYKLSGDLLSSGHFPFWNMYSGGGLPLFANMQSAVLFPLTWIFYFLPIKIALLLYAYTKLLLAGMFTFWFLRELKLRFVSSLLGALLFAFANANLVWLLWPLTNIIVLLPLGMLLVEKYICTHAVRYPLLLAGVVTLGIFGGHPQTFLYIFSAIALYALYRILFQHLPLRSRLWQLWVLAAAFAGGLVMAAVSILPFVEYLRLSGNLAYRTGFELNPFYLPKLLFLANFMPDFFGNLGLRYFTYLPVPNYSEMALGYVGTAGFVLAVLAFARKPRNYTVLFFGLLALLVLCLVYRIEPIYTLVNSLPGFSVNYNNRLLYVWAFCGAVLASFGVEYVLNQAVSKRAAAISAGVVFLLGAGWFIAAKIITPGWELKVGWPVVNLWQNMVFMAFVSSVVVTFLIVKYLPGRRALVALFMLVVLETAVHGAVFNRAATDEEFYPLKEPLVTLQSRFPENYGRTFFYGHAFLANVGTWYRINHFTDHDTMYLMKNKELKARAGNFNFSPEYTFDDPDLNVLRVLGVRYLVYPAMEGVKFLEVHGSEVDVRYRDASYIVFELKGVLPRVFMVKAVSEQDAAKQLEVIFEGGDRLALRPVERFELQPNGEYQIAFRADEPAFLVVTDNYYPGWQAEFSNGKNEPVREIFGMRAVAISGSGELALTYEPKSFRLGLQISLFALSAWLLAFLVAWQQKKL